MYIVESLCCKIVVISKIKNDKKIFAPWLKSIRTKCFGLVKKVPIEQHTDFKLSKSDGPTCFL